jgi:hypothetical protein
MKAFYLSNFFNIFKTIVNLINVGIATQLRLNCSHCQYIRRWKRFYIVLLIFAPFFLIHVDGTKVISIG